MGGPCLQRGVVRVRVALVREGTCAPRATVCASVALVLCQDDGELRVTVDRDAEAREFAERLALTAYRQRSVRVYGRDSGAVNLSCD